MPNDSMDNQIEIIIDTLNIHITPTCQDVASNLGSFVKCKFCITPSIAGKRWELSFRNNLFSKFPHLLCIVINNIKISGLNEWIEYKTKFSWTGIQGTIIFPSFMFTWPN